MTITKQNYSKSKATATVTENIAMAAETLDDIIGGPPDKGTGITQSDNLRANSVLNIQIAPCIPEQAMGLSLFSLNNNKGWQLYSQWLNSVGFAPSALQNSNKAIIIAAIADSFPSDSFQNEYGESFLGQLTDVAGQAFSQVTQVFGGQNALETGRLAGQSLQKMQGGGILGSGLRGAGSILEDVAWGANNILKDMKGDGTIGVLGSIGNVANRLLGGGRIDFPFISKGSSYTPAFSCTVKLYNPNPGRDEDTIKYILGPLAALLTLALPQVNNPENASEPQKQKENSITYNYPFFHQVKCPGLFYLPMGAISNITVVKGGDHGGVGFNQRVSMVDVKIDFVSLFNSMVLSNLGVEQRPTLKGYLDNMKDSVQIQSIYKETTINQAGDSPIYPESPAATTTPQVGTTARATTEDAAKTVQLKNMMVR
jgi:hypothetical protein